LLSSVLQIIYLPPDNKQQMSNSTNTAIAHNVYFDGNVQSLGLETAKGKATLGVMKKGTYQFSTSTPEKMVIISGIMKVKLVDSDWVAYHEQQQFDVAAGSSFDIICDADVAYLCYYGA
jgi:uncharacterized protein YaiE (UPF0345 family)